MDFTQPPPGELLKMIIPQFGQFFNRKIPEPIGITRDIPGGFRVFHRESVKICQQEVIKVDEEVREHVLKLILQGLESVENALNLMLQECQVKLEEKKWR